MNSLSKAAPAHDAGSEPLRPTAKTFEGTTLGEAYGPNTAGVFQYPFYTKEELKAYANHPWFYNYKGGTMSPVQRSINSFAQATRAWAISKGLGRLLLPSAAQVPELREYMDRTYPDTVPDCVEYYDNQSQLTEMINARKATGEKIVPVHPFIGTDADSYYISPDRIASLNDKANISELTVHIPKQIQVTASDVASVLHAEKLLQAVLKEQTGSGGDTTFVFDAKKDMTPEDVVKRFAPGTQVLVEEYVEHDVDYGVQIHVNQNGAVSIVHFSPQITNGNGVHQGNDLDFTLTPDDLPIEVLKVALEAGRSAAQKGWYGLAGIDILYKRPKNEHVKGIAKLIDPNFRVTAATPLLLLRDHIRKQTGNTLARSASFSPKDTSMTIRDALRAIDPQLFNGDAILFGGSEMEGGSLRLYGAALGNTPEQVEENMRNLRRPFEA